MTSAQITYLLGIYGRDKLRRILFDNGRMHEVRFENKYNKILEFDDVNEILLIQEIASPTDKVIISAIPYSVIQGLEFDTDTRVEIAYK